MIRPLVVLAVLLMTGSAVADARNSGFPQAAPVTNAPDLRKDLMERASALQAAHHGIFRVEVTEIVLPAFPAGQPMTETEAIVTRQKLGTLRKFKGEQMPNEGTMYVSTFTLMKGMMSHIYVVLDFDFDGTTRQNMVLRKVKAFIRATNM